MKPDEKAAEADLITRPCCKVSAPYPGRGSNGTHLPHAPTCPQRGAA